MSSGTAIYKILGIEPGATFDEIRVAYRKKALETHPDQNPDIPDASDRFAKVKKAYDLLSNESARKRWHRQYKLPWIWEESEEPAAWFETQQQVKAKEELPEELNWACVACHGQTKYQCKVCKVYLCEHFTIMIKLEGYTPQPVCVECKRNRDTSKYAVWYMKQRLRRGGF